MKRAAILSFYPGIILNMSKISVVEYFQMVSIETLLLKLTLGSIIVFPVQEGKISRFAINFNPFQLINLFLE